MRSLARLLVLLATSVAAIGLPAAALAAAPWHQPDQRYRMPIDIAAASTPTAVGSRVTIAGLGSRLAAHHQMSAGGTDLRVVWQPTAPGGALQSDTGTYLSIPADLGSPATFSIELWLRLQPIDLGVGGGEQAIVSTSTWRLNRTTAGLCAGTACAPLPPLGEWHQVMLTATATSATVSVDGIAGAPGPALLGPLDANVSIGAIPTGNVSLRGDIDELRISNVIRPLAAPSTAPLTTDAATLALYHLDDAGSSVTHDASGNGRDAALVTGRRFAWVEGRSGNAVDLNGSGSFLRIGGDLGTPTDATIEMWVKPAVYAAGWSYLGDSRQTAAGWWFADNAAICFNGAGCMPRPSVGQWHHIAVTLTATDTRLYMDGVLAGTFAATSRVLGSRLVLGARHSLDEVFRGAIDEVRISNTARYTSNFVPAERYEPDAQTLVLLHLDEGTGTLGIDSSGAGHDARIRTPTEAWTGGVVASAPPLPARVGAAMVDAAGDISFQLQETLPANTARSGEYLLYTGNDTAPAPLAPFDADGIGPSAVAGALEARTAPTFTTTTGALGAASIQLTEVLAAELAPSDCVVDWGDAASDHAVAGAASHAYRTNRVFEVTATCTLADGRVARGVIPLAVTTADDVPPRILTGALLRETRTGARYVFRISDDGVGIATTNAYFRGVPVVIQSGGIVDLRGKRDGPGLLVVVALDRNGNRQVFRSRLLIDGRGPRILEPLVPFVLGPRVTVSIKDDGAGTASLLARAAVPKLGRNLVTLRAHDRVGNRSLRRMVVNRRPSLSDPSQNRGLGLEATTRSSIDDAFRFRFARAPWYARTEHSPWLVREVQWRLQRFGYLSRAYRQTGELDMATIDAIKSFQRAHGVPGIATVGPRTRAALDRELLHGA